MEDKEKNFQNGVRWMLLGIALMLFDITITSTAATLVIFLVVRAIGFIMILYGFVCTKSGVEK